MDKLSLLKDITNAFGPSGFEDAVLEAARAHAPQGAEITEDNLRNLYLRRPADKDGRKPVVMLDAHTDEVGFMVQAIKPNGLLTFITVGGWVPSTVPAHRVLVQNRDGQLIPGIVATKPPHYMSEAERKAPLDIGQMSIDVGACSAKEVEEVFRIGVGAPVAPDTAFEYNEQTDMMMAKAFDCRAGCACVLDAMARLMDKDLGVAPVGALASQEEVGVRGAVVTARTVKPDVAICFEGCPADDNFAPEWSAQTVLKKGPMLRHMDNGMITNPRFQRLALDTAKELGIPVQEAVRGGGKTNGASIHLSGKGVPTIVIGIPVRYIHTHYGYAALSDYEASVQLGVAVIERLNADVIAKL
ncbi:M20/M25/M40 family metallo-hydrolase [Ruminococcaceae bacterium OttesenSCG-928-A11]|nr:M20/M25/M40 family metallo-hydrolase [Ruminococcaceae bacterium OttesenSCG-928-A11]